jgi:hypothetical protein
VHCQVRAPLRPPWLPVTDHVVAGRASRSLANLGTDRID